MYNDTHLANTLMTWFQLYFSIYPYFVLNMTVQIDEQIITPLSHANLICNKVIHPIRCQVLLHVYVSSGKVFQVSLGGNN